MFKVNKNLKTYALGVALSLVLSSSIVVGLVAIDNNREPQKSEDLEKESETIESIESELESESVSFVVVTTEQTETETETQDETQTQMKMDTEAETGVPATEAYIPPETELEIIYEEPVWEETEPPIVEEIPQIKAGSAVTQYQNENLDRTKPLYNVYKNGCYVPVDTDLQWYIRDICMQHNILEKYVYGMILSESTFHYDARNGNCLGLCQINIFWIRGANIEHFTDDYYYRDLTNPYDNLLTMSEMWNYAKNSYGLDLSTEDGMMRVLYWHATGKNPLYISSSSYFNLVSQYASELEPLQ